MNQDHELHKCPNQKSTVEQKGEWQTTELKSARAQSANAEGGDMDTAIERDM